MSRAAVLLCALAFAPLAAAAPSGGTEVAFVAVEDEDLVVAVELETGRTRARIRVPNGPHNMDVSRSRDRVLVTSPPAGAVTLIDAPGLRTIATFRGFGYPHDVDFSRDASVAYVTDERRGHVVVLDLAARRVAARVAVGAGPHDLAVAGNRLWVTHGRATRHLTVLDASIPSRPRLAGRVQLAHSPHDVVAASSRRIYVTYWNTSAVGALDTVARRVVFHRPLGREAHHLAVEPERGRVWVTDHGLGRAQLLVPASGRLVQTISPCSGAHHVGIGAFRGRVAVVCYDYWTLRVCYPLYLRTTYIPIGRSLNFGV